MKLKSLIIRSIRNIHEVQIPCGQGIHFIHGLNAQGKTSILESIYVLSNLRSFRDSDLGSLVKRGTLEGQIKGHFELDPTTEAELKVELVKGGKRFEKRAYINQKLTRSALDYYGLKLNHSPVQFHAINLNPTSTDLIRGDPAYRRNFLNQVISSETPTYMATLKSYQKSLDQKNALLKQEERLDAALLRILNENIVKYGSYLIQERLKYLEKSAPKVAEFLKSIAPLQNPINLAYKNAETLYFTGHFSFPSIKNLEENLHQKLMENGPLERIRKVSLVGPHRDDLLFKVGEFPRDDLPDLVDVGSQGEVRSFLLSLKLAELEEFKRASGIQPVLLIDDFSSELDSTRRGFLLSYLKNSDLQIFVTSTDDLSSSFQGSGISLLMNQGKVSY